MNGKETNRSTVDFISLTNPSCDLPFPNDFNRLYIDEELPLSGIPGVYVDGRGNHVIVKEIALFQLEAAAAPVEYVSSRGDVSDRGIPLSVQKELEKKGGFYDQWTKSENVRRGLEKKRTLQNEARIFSSNS